jgi:hypothetical protein
VNRFVLVVFVLLPLAGLVLGLRKWLLFWRGVRVEATILGFEKSYSEASSDSSTLQLPIVELDDRRVRVTLSSELPARHSAGVGDTVRLIHPRGNLKQATYDHPVTLWLVPAMCFGPALVFIVYIAAAVAWHRLFE